MRIKNGLQFPQIVLLLLASNAVIADQSSAVTHIESIQIVDGTSAVRILIGNDLPNPASCSPPPGFGSPRYIDIPLESPTGNIDGRLLNVSYFVLLNSHRVTVLINSERCSAESFRVLSGISVLNARYHKGWGS